MERAISLDRVRNDVRRLIEPYLKKLLEIHGDNLISIVLYGSAAGKDFSPKTSDVNLLVVLEELSFSHLKKNLQLISKGINKRITAPLFLTRQHIDSSKDVFPIEFLEVKENHILLYGEDLFGQIDINQEHIRLFCEEQIKGKLIRLRQAYLEIGLKRKGIEALMKESMYALLPIFRALLRLKGIMPPIEKEGILNILSSEFGLDKDVFLAILKDKRDDERIGGKDVELYFEKYIGQIQKLAIVTDQL